MRSLRPLVPILALILAGACASGGGAGALPRLEAQQQQEPQSASVNRALGIAYYQAGKFPDARRALEKATQLDPKDGTTALYLGLTAEEQGDLPAARKAYSSYIEFGRTSRVRGQLQSKLAALSRKEIEADAKVAVKQESTIGNDAGSSRTVAVLPMRFRGADSTLKPLERGIADLLTTDLARSSQLTLVERSRMQALLDEMKLQQSGTTDVATNVRAGKMVRAGRVVQGSILQMGGTNLRVDAAVINVPTTLIQGTAQGADQLDQLFSLEKKIALDLFRQLGVALTVAERNAIEERPTKSLAAFLSYSRGLTAEDEGRYDDASRHFNDAARIDPSFNAAQQKGKEAATVSAGVAATPAVVTASLSGTAEGAVVQAATQGQTSTTSSTSTSGTTTGSTAKETAGGLNPSAPGAATAGATSSSTPPPSTPTGDPVAKGTGADQGTQQGTVSFTIPRPKP